MQEVTAKKPTNIFEWRSVRTVIEFKTGSITSPPTRYTKGNYIKPRRGRKYLSPKSIGNDEQGMEPSPTNFMQGFGRR